MVCLPLVRGTHHAPGITLRAWRTLLCAKRFFGVPQTDTIEGLLAESSENQQEVTDQLGLQVRQAVEVLVQTLDRIDLEQRRAVLQDVPPTELYEASLTVMMRLVFLFCAEERGLLLLGDPLYDQHYAVSTLSAQLRETADQHGEEILERRYDAWSRLLATFRVVHAGVRHENLRLPAYGGSLFNPDRFPFLEGRQHGSSWRDTAAKSLPVDNRTVLHLMEALQYLQVSGERRRLSFRALDIEQIGHVYEGLLDHTALRAPEGEPVLGLIGTRKKNETKEPEVFLSRLEGAKAKSDEALLAYLVEETGRSEKTILNALNTAASLHSPKPQTPDPRPRFRIACGNDEPLLQRVLPFAALIRDDTFGRPVVILPGSYYVTQGSDRRQTGTHYTPRSLTEPIVQYTLEPLVYEGPAEGTPKEEWELRSPKEILGLKVCDMAMGSGAFLVQTVRYLAERLVEAWEETEQEIVNHRCTQMDTDDGKAPLQRVTENVMSRPSSRKLAEKLQQSELPSLEEDAIGVNRRSSVVKRIRITPEGTPSTGDPTETLIPDNPDERLIYARRIICDRCIYGVDINPLAVEMAKLSLWLITMDKGRAFSFLNHALKCGDSLLGLWDVEQVRKFHLDASVPAQAGLWGDHVHQIFEYALQKRRELESFMVNDVKDSEAKARLLAEADAAMDVVRMLCDMLITAVVTTTDGNSQRRGRMLPQAFDTERDRIFEEIRVANSREQVQSAVEAVRSLVPEYLRKLNAGNPNHKNPRRPFHWPVEFPEVFSSGGMVGPGFDAILGNPPFMGGLSLFSASGGDYRNYLVDVLAQGRRATRGTADLCAYFFLRSVLILNSIGSFGLLATNTIAQGDTMEIGLEPLLKEELTVYRAVSSMKWPGTATLFIACVHATKRKWLARAILNVQTVDHITPHLTDFSKAAGPPQRLSRSKEIAYVGSYVAGRGFVLTLEEAKALFKADVKSHDVIFSYLNGEDLTSSVDQTASRAIFNFFDWPLDARADNAGVGPPYASDYPQCLDIVQERVRPEREALEPINAFNRTAARCWWQYGGPRFALYKKLCSLKRTLVAARVSKYLVLAWVKAEQVFSDQLIVFPTGREEFFAILQCSLHECWARYYCSTLGDKGLRYSPSDAVESFPFPEFEPHLKKIAQAYHETRGSLQSQRNIGLTDLYNYFHRPSEQADDIQRLRELHAEMDRAVADAYGWTDLDLGHNFHETKQGIHFTISESARREILDRLLALNHQRYAEEVAQGLHDKGSKPKATRKKAKADQEELF